MFHHYHFVSRWKVPADPERVFEILSKPEDYGAWWHARHLEARVLDPGQAGGVGKTVRFKMRGALPYAFEWTIRCREIERPCRIVSDSSGDFLGRGIWTFEDAGGATQAVFDWKVEVCQPFVRRFSVLLRPFFAANHHWVMKQGERGLRKRFRESMVVLNRTDFHTEKYRKDGS